MEGYSRKITKSNLTTKQTSENQQRKKKIKFQIINSSLGSFSSFFVKFLFVAEKEEG